MAAAVPSTRCTVPATSAPSIARRPSSPAVKACGSSHTMPTTPNDAPLVVTQGHRGGRAHVAALGVGQQVGVGVLVLADVVDRDDA